MNRSRTGACDLLVLCGGQGTRLRAVVHDRPKPMAMIGERPFVDFVIESFVRQGVRRVILCTGHMGNHFEDWYRGHARSYELCFSRETTPLGTAGAIGRAANLICSDPFMVVNGDSLCEADPEMLLAFHAVKGGCATLTLTPANQRTDVGFVSLNQDARIVTFGERQPESASRFHNAGIYVFDRSLLARLPEFRPCSIETDVLPFLLERGVYGFVSEAPLYDIGTPDRLATFQAHADACSRPALTCSSYESRKALGE